MIPIFIGYDPNEVIAYHVLCHSILSRSSEPVSITPINLQNLKCYTRERNPLQSTEFSFSRFLVPYLSGYRGRAIFMDCDMLCLGDIAELYEAWDYQSAVQVVKHDYTPSTEKKFLNQVQTRYPMKNWSSVMLFNCQHFDCQRLTPEAVNTESGLYLHQFKWTDSVGDLPANWNCLVGEQDFTDPKLLHYTLGGPWFDEPCDYSREWFDEKDRLYSPLQTERVIPLPRQHSG